MQFLIADTFTDALARLPAQEQKAAKTSAFDLQTNPAAPGLQLHRIDKSKDPNFWSVRVNRDLRIIVHKSVTSMLLAYVDHHDKAYAWAERRRIEAHPKTGAIQIVEVRERVEDIAPVLPFEPRTPEVVPEPFSARPCFGGLTADDLLCVGVPADWVKDILTASEDRFLEIADHIPQEAAEALLDYVATGKLQAPRPATPAAVAMQVSAEPRKAVPREEIERLVEQRGYAHPDAQRRFRLIEDSDALKQALDYPWDKWMVFLHPSQRQIVDQQFAGPARVMGSAGTGKTIVALHRAVRLARTYPTARILLTTFSHPLANMLERKLKLLVADTGSIVPRITVTHFHGVAEELYQLAFGGRPHIVPDDVLRSMLAKAAEAHQATDISTQFLLSEWSNVVDAFQISSEAAYATVPRLGRKNRMGAKQRARLWPVFEAVRSALVERSLSTWAKAFSEISAHYAAKKDKPFDHIVVDEAQDLGVPELRFLAAIAPPGRDSLFFAGDLGQRIFQQPISWLGLGVDVRGRSQTLKVNYRTSHQIREIADRLMPQITRDVDGIEQRRSGTVSAFNGPEPEIIRSTNEQAEIASVAQWIKRALADGFTAAEIGIFVRTHAQLDRARGAVKEAGREALVLSERGEEPGERISVGTMHLAKGLEFKAVAVMACDDEVLPLQSRVEMVADEVELDDVYETERQLLYVACTRARDRLLVSCVEPGSEFLKDFVV